MYDCAKFQVNIMISFEQCKFKKFTHKPFQPLAKEIFSISQKLVNLIYITKYCDMVCLGLFYSVFSCFEFFFIFLPIFSHGYLE